MSCVAFMLIGIGLDVLRSFVPGHILAGQNMVQHVALLPLVTPRSSQRYWCNVAFVRDADVARCSPYSFAQHVVLSPDAHSTPDRCC